VSPQTPKPGEYAQKADGWSDDEYADAAAYLAHRAALVMVDAARRRLGDRAMLAVGDLDTYVPDAPVAATSVFRAIYYASDRAAFFARVAGFTERKLVFDLNPRQFRPDLVTAELDAAGFRRVVMRPFFVPQTRRLPGPATAALKALERTGPVARLAHPAPFTYVVAACR
jgi:hypothetical protein